MTTMTTATTILPSSKCFETIQTLNFEQLEQLSTNDVRMILPCLIRICCCYFDEQQHQHHQMIQIDQTKKWSDNRKKIRKIIMNYTETNDLIKIFNLDYQQLECEVKKDLQLRLKSTNTNPLTNQDSYLLSSINNNESLIKIFESNDDNHLIRMKLILNELLTLLIYYKNYSYNNTNQPISIELFDIDLYIDEFVDYLYVAIIEMPTTLQLLELIESLLLIKNGIIIIIRLSVNFPELFNEICSTLINNSTDSTVLMIEEQNNFQHNNRINVLRKLCQINRLESLLIRQEIIDICRMPTLIIMITLDQLKYQNDDQKFTNSDILSFLTGILLNNDDRIRQWFTQYIKRKNLDQSSIQTKNCFLEFREQLLLRFRLLTESMINISNNNDNTNEIQESIITESCLMLRLYCALRGVAMMKLTDDETQAISKMIVCRPSHIDIGVRFVSIGLCMILAFPQMIISQETEIIEWIKWLVKEENYFGQKANTRASFGEMLLLIAIYFHSNQLTQIGELVSSTIGIKHSSRTNDLTLIKHIFIQDIFTEQTVTAHAIKVPVTKNLNDTIVGTLPIHCIYQLLKSRAFTKNRVPIKNWIFQQICNCRPPIHHILPSLIEAYVNSILLPTSQSAHMTNEPISENDLNRVFQRTVYSFEIYHKQQKFNDFSTSDDDVDDSSDNNNDIDDDDLNNDYDSNDTDKIDSDTDSDSNDNDNKMDVDNDDTEDDDNNNSDNNDENQNLNNQKNEKDEIISNISCLLTSQLLFLYYILLYEDVRLSNIRMVDRPSFTYSKEFMSNLPIFYLIQRTKTQEYVLLRPQLLRLISLHYPYLCLVKDWLPKENFSLINHHQLFSLKYKDKIRLIMIKRKFLIKLYKKIIKDKYKYSSGNNGEIFYFLKQLIQLPDELLWPFSRYFIKLLSNLLFDNNNDDNDNTIIPKKILILIKKIWFRLNSIFPTKLWVMTINVLRNNLNNSVKIWYGQQTWDDIVMNPNFIFYCDERIFRIPELMEILLHMINGFLSASKIKCIHHNMECILRHTSDEEKKKRDELQRIYNITWDSAAIQMLLDCCSINIDNKLSSSSNNLINNNCLLSNRREIQGLICTHLHQCFITDWNLAKTVSIQGYDQQYLTMTVSGIPSLHICLDFIPDILQYNDLNKQSFAIDLASYLCVQYPIPRSFSIAKLCFEFINVHFTILPNDKFFKFFINILPSLERMTRTFPPLIEGFLKLLIKLGQRNISSLMKPGSKFLLTTTTNDHHNQQLKLNNKKLIDMTWLEFNQFIINNQKNNLSSEQLLSLTIQKTFSMVCQLNSLNRIYNDRTI